MKVRPVIGVTTQSLQSIDGIPAALPSSVVMNERYYTAVAQAGGTPVLIPLLDDQSEALRAAYEVCDGILLPGGVDLDPASFGESPHPRLGRVDPARDRVELTLTKWAVEEHKPILGLCRGLQVINVALGGTLWQDIASQCAGAIRHDYFPTHGFARDHLAHDVTLAGGTRMRHLMDHDRIAVNSMHHQAIQELAPSLVASAVAPDGLIEAAELPDDGFVVGVQWHPEVFEMSDPGTQRLFAAFVTAAQE
ncbi:MAG TPA: gamma-glutamyl-gamma-aminobutyrate hydrolase family protein [Gemmatimonadaceae bacterium]|nr:gamma-glutamyl-gamma-aminobutyrate hydrolase family protein [Gemmatimonadaceae bacterium]